MTSKFQFISILSLLLINAVLSYEIIPKYGAKKVYDHSVVLETKDFDVGDNIYISVTTYDYCFNTYLYYQFYQSINDKLVLVYSDSVYQTSSSTVSGFSYEEEYTYKIKKPSSNGNYLYLESNCYPPLYFENTEKDGSIVVLVVSIVVSVVVVVVFIIIICCCCKNCRRGTVAAVPVSGVYGVSPYSVQPNYMMVQPVPNIQPYDPNYIQNQNYSQNYNQNYTSNINNNNQNVQYNSGAAAQPASDFRMNQAINYEKPH